MLKVYGNHFIFIIDTPSLKGYVMYTCKTIDIFGWSLMLYNT